MKVNLITLSLIPPDQALPEIPENIFGKISFYYPGEIGGRTFAHAWYTLDGAGHIVHRNPETPGLENFLSGIAQNLRLSIEYCVQSTCPESQ